MTKTTAASFVARAATRNLGLNMGERRRGGIGRGAGHLLLRHASPDAAPASWNPPFVPGGISLWRPPGHALSQALT